METNKEIISMLLCDIINNCHIEENGLIYTKTVLTPLDIEQIKGYLYKTKRDLNLSSEYLNNSIKTINSILHLWPYKDE